MKTERLPKVPDQQRNNAFSVCKTTFEKYYQRYNRRESVDPDPVQFLYQYKHVADRKIAGLISATLAYGRIKQIMASVQSALDRMCSPYSFLIESTPDKIRRTFSGFRHRFATEEHFFALLWGIKGVLERHKSLENCFQFGLRKEDRTVFPAMSHFVRELKRDVGEACGHLLACPEKSIACKRLNLFLRWMVRQDTIDPGGWNNISRTKLVIPLDTHMNRICRTIGLTRRHADDRQTALEITDGFRRFAHEDPVRYDFTISHLGIRNQTSLNAFLRECICAEI